MFVFVPVTGLLFLVDEVVVSVLEVSTDAEFLMVPVVVTDEIVGIDAFDVDI